MANTPSFVSVPWQRRLVALKFTLDFLAPPWTVQVSILEYSPLLQFLLVPCKVVGLWVLCKYLEEFSTERASKP